MTKNDLPLPSCRRIDALIHQVFYEPVLMTGRGPFCRGNPVPLYTSSVDAVLELKDLLLDDWYWDFDSKAGFGTFNIRKNGSRSGPSCKFDNTTSAISGAFLNTVLQAAAIEKLDMKPAQARKVVKSMVEMAALEDYEFGETISFDEFDDAKTPVPAPA